MAKCLSCNRLPALYYVHKYNPEKDWVDGSNGYHCGYDYLGRCCEKCRGTFEDAATGPAGVLAWFYRQRAKVCQGLGIWRCDEPDLQSFNLSSEQEVPACSLRVGHKGPHSWSADRTQRWVIW